MTEAYGYYKSVFERLPKPFAFVDLDLMDENIQAIKRAAGNKRVRIASKSIRCVDVLRHILAAEDCFQGIMCYTADEAAFLARQGFDDLLLGYPQFEPNAIAELTEWIGQGRSITFMIDCLAHVEQIERIGRDNQIRVPLCLDIDMSADYPGLHFGVWRSPLGAWAQVRPLAERIAASPWLRLDGIMGYEAQIAGVGDNLPGKPLKNAIVRLLKKRSIPEVARRRREIVEGLAGMGIDLRFVNAGGTGSMDSSREESCVTEITAGSGFYAPGLFDQYASFRYKPAAGFAVEVVRQPRPDIVTCMGGGYTASGALTPDKQVKVYLPEGLKLLPLEGAGEVQTPLRVTGAIRPAIGDPVFFRHAKAGELCERFLKLHAVRQGAIVGEYDTYRGMGACFV